MIKSNNDEFIKKAKEIHQNKYDYSLVDYKNNYTKVKIICPIHGIFEQRPNNHLRGQGCFKCFGNFKKSEKQFIQEAKEIHQNKYDYSLVDYKNNYTKVKIICPIHGEFEQSPSNHLNGNGCPKCANNIKYTNDEFIKKAKEIHQNKYDYSLVIYKNNQTKVKIICPIHGEFKQSPSSHLNGNGCPKCANNIKYTNDEFIKKAKEIHQNKYDYSLVDYKNSQTKIIIICPIHGEFKQSPSSHLNGNGCSKCANNFKKTKEYFIQEAKEIHQNKYDYSLVDYKNSDSKITIICPIHGEFKQIPYSHLKGHGCQKCANKKIRLKTIERLNNNLENGYQIKPNFNPKACEIFDEIMKENNIFIQHAENGGEFYIKELGYWVDGYDKENNTVYEYDEKYHKYQREKDKIREKEIKKLLKCKFIRIKNYE